MTLNFLLISLSAFIYFICFCLFSLQGHRFLGKTHQRIWYENASTGTGHFLLLIRYFLSNTKFDFDHSVRGHRLLAQWIISVQQKAELVNDVHYTRRVMMVADDKRGTVATNNKYLFLKGICLIHVESN